MEQNEQRNERKSKAKKVNYKSIRIYQETSKKLTRIQKLANKKLFGKKVHPDSIVALALDLITQSHIQQLQEASLSHADRLEMQYREYLKNHPATSKDDFLGKLLRGEVGSSSSENATNSDLKLQQEEA